METTIKAANRKHVKAKTVFSHSIKFLKDEAIKVICQRTGDEHYNVSDIQSETGASTVDGLLSQPNTHYMVADIGGTFSFYFVI